MFLPEIHNHPQWLRGGKSITLCSLILWLTVGCQRQNQSSHLIITEKELPQASHYEQCQPFNLDYITHKGRATKPWHLAYLFKTNSDPFWQEMTKGVEKISEELGIKPTVKFTEKQPNTLGDVKKQITLILEVVENNNIDGLIIAPEDSIQLVPIIEKVREQGIPVIVIDTPIDTEQILTFVTFDNFAGGKILGEWVINKITTSSQKNKNINVLILEGSLHEENTIERRQGFLEGLTIANQNYSLDILDMKTANWNAENAKVITQDWLETFSDIDVIMAADDQMAMGASEAVREFNRKGIIITGFDGTPYGLNGIKEGKIDATIKQFPEKQITLVTQLMISRLEEKIQTMSLCQLIGQKQVDSSLLITKDNIDEALNP
ncbi:MAG: sugar ABC transporter substrate-binding protein [Crocosphaera sp.]|nr:sugar ABC transporter substrate-binding protein [Crocosphaera sp.]